MRAYIDQLCAARAEDAPIFSRPLREHRELAEKALEKLKERKLRAAPRQCEAAQKEIKLLGFIASEASLKVSAEKLDAARGWPMPTRIADLRSLYLNSARALCAAPIKRNKHAQKAALWRQLKERRASEANCSEQRSEAAHRLLADFTNIGAPAERLLRCSCSAQSGLRAKSAGQLDKCCLGNPGRRELLSKPARALSSAISARARASGFCKHFSA